MSESLVPLLQPALTIENIGLVAWLFHIVKNPSDGKTQFFVLPGSYEDIEGLIAPGWHDTVEEPILNKNVSVTDKSLAIGRQFAYAGQVALQLPPEQRIAAYLQSTDDFLKTGMYPEITVGAVDILPEAIVLDAMFDTFVTGTARARCRPLEDWLYRNGTQ